MTEPYRLYYWPFLPGRGEFARLILEETGAAYVDVGRLPESEGGGVPAIRRFYAGQGDGFPVFAAPVLEYDEVRLSQSAVICAHLGERHGLAPEDPTGRAHALQVQLTIADVVDEAHNTHHPLSAALYYKDQKEEARRAAKHFLDERLPRWLLYFERVLAFNGGDWLLGDALTYPDLSMFQLLQGLAYAFPKGFTRAAESAPGLTALGERVAVRPRVAAYLSSDRRLPFNEHGVFRHYPELDLGG